MASRVNNQRGAALVTVLLFMTLTFILITSMLSVTGNEIVIAGIQRDSTRALDLAQAGIEEAKMRIAEGRPFMAPNWRSAIDANGTADPNVTVNVIRNYVGSNSAYLEIRSDATAGRARRKLSALVLQQMISFPPNITFAASVIEQGSASIICGDAYARTFIQYKDYPTQAAGCTEPPAISYAGWRMSKAAPGAVGPCYSNPQCTPLDDPGTNADRWYPGHRRSEPATTATGRDIVNQTNKCLAGGGGPLPSDTIVGVLAERPTNCGGAVPCNPPDVQTYNVYGFYDDDPDGGGPIPPQAVIPGILPCGLPYKLVPQTFEAEDGLFRTRLFKTVAFEQWFALYWRFDEVKMKMVKRNGSACIDAYCLSNGLEPNLFNNAKLGAVPPFPDIDQTNQNYDCKKNGGGVLNTTPINCDDPPGVTSDIGCKYPEVACVPAVSRPVAVVLGGTWTINGNLKGHGTIIVNGDLTVNGDFEYWGTIIVNGVMTLGAGSAVVHGGLVADSTLRISGNIQVEGGGTVGMVPTGRSNVLGRGWWER